MCARRSAATNACRSGQYGLANSPRSTGFQSVVTALIVAGAVGRRGRPPTIARVTLAPSHEGLDSLATRPRRPAGDVADAARTRARAARRRPPVGQARRPDRARRGRQQGAQAGVPLRRGARGRRPGAGHRRRRAVQPLPDDGGRRRRARPRGPPRAVRRPARCGRPATSCCRRCSAPSSTSSGARPTTGASWRSPASSSPPSSPATVPCRTRSRSAGAPRSERSGTSPPTSSWSSSAAAAAIAPAAVVHASSSGGTHAGLVAGRACCARSVTNAARRCSRSASPRASTPACPTCGRWPARRSPCSAPTADAVTGDDVEIDTRWMGADYGVPTAAGDEAIRWAARARRLGARPHLQRQGLRRAARQRRRAAAGGRAARSCSSTPAGSRPSSLPAGAPGQR